MNVELIERLAVILAALELSPGELAAVVIEDCRNRGSDEDDAERLRWEMARLIEPSPVGPIEPDSRAVYTEFMEQATTFGLTRPQRCGAVSALALGPSVCRRHAGHDGPHVEADTSWMED